MHADVLGDVQPESTMAIEGRVQQHIVNVDDGNLNLTASASNGQAPARNQHMFVDMIKVAEPIGVRANEHTSGTRRQEAAPPRESTVPESHGINGRNVAANFLEATKLDTLQDSR